jgi:hypothetical protein
VETNYLTLRTLLNYLLILRYFFYKHHTNNSKYQQYKIRDRLYEKTQLLGLSLWNKVWLSGESPALIPVAIPAQQSTPKAVESATPSNFASCVSGKLKIAFLFFILFILNHGT